MSTVKTYRPTVIAPGSLGVAGRAGVDVAVGGAVLGFYLAHLLSRVFVHLDLIGVHHRVVVRSHQVVTPAPAAQPMPLRLFRHLTSSAPGFSPNVSSPSRYPSCTSSPGVRLYA